MCRQGSPRAAAVLNPCLNTLCRCSLLSLWVQVEAGMKISSAAVYNAVMMFMLRECTPGWGSAGSRSLAAGCTDVLPASSGVGALGSPAQPVLRAALGSLHP